MYEHTLLSSNYSARNDSFLDNDLMLKCENFDYYNSYHLNYIDNQIILYLAKEKDMLSENVHDIIKYLQKNYYMLDFENDKNIILLCHIIMYFTCIHNDNKQGQLIYTDIKAYLNKNDKVMTYYKEQTEFCLKIKDDLKKLIEDDFIYPFHGFERWSIFDVLYQYEKNISLSL